MNNRKAKDTPVKTTFPREVIKEAVQSAMNGTTIKDGEFRDEASDISIKDWSKVAPNFAAWKDEPIILGTGGELYNNGKEGLRFNNGKLRYDLLEPFAIKELVKVFSKGAEKYAPRNWEKGMSWSKVIASLKRHIAAFESGEDFDPETGCFHMAHAAWNALALVSYYKLAPQFDDRDHAYLKYPKVGLDIDDVICDWIGAWREKFGHPEPKSWHFSYKTHDEFKSFEGESLKEFYLNLPPKIDPSEIPFEPHCYITARSVPTELTMQWIEKHGFPTAPVHSVGFGESKVKVAKEAGVEVFVDDRFDNFVELNKAGICCYLLTRPHNIRYEVGYKRINSLKELFERFK